MADTIRQLAALQALFPDNTAGEISPQDLRDFLVSAMPTGRSATKVVASAAASDLRKAQADYVLGGPDIQAAIDAAGNGSVELTEGPFTVVTTILANKTCTLRGAGPLSTVITLANSSNVDVIQLSAENVITLSNFQIQGNKGNQTAGSGVKFVSGERHRIENVEVHNAKDYGFWAITPSKAIVAYGCRAYSCGNHGFYWNGPGANQFQSLYSDLNGGDGFYLYATESQLNNLIADQNSLAGIRMYSMTDSEASNLKSFNNTLADLVIWSCSRLTASNLVSVHDAATGKTGSDPAGLQLVGNTACSIRGGSIYNIPTVSGSGWGILLANYNGSIDCVVEGFAVQSQDGDLYFVEPANLTGNRISNNILRGAVPVYFNDAGTGEYVYANNVLERNSGWAPIDPGALGAISVVRGSGSVALTTAGAETRTLAAPSFIGQELTLYCKTFVGNCVVTCATTVNEAGNNTITFTATGQACRLYAVEEGSTLRWRLASVDGAQLSTV